MLKLVECRVRAAMLAATCLTMGVSAAKADPATDPNSIWTLQDENSSITTSKVNDKYYVNGLRLAWTSPSDDMPDFLAAFGHSLYGNGTQRLTVDVTQSIYTPADTLAVPPDPKDRPYAGVLVAGLTLLHDTETSRDVIGIQAGLVGPDAQAEQLQNGFHDVVGFGHTKGWAYQIPDEFVGELIGQHTWRVPLGEIDGLEMDTLPQIEGGLGNLRIYGLLGSVFRIGQDLDADFGPSRIRPGLAGSDAYTQTQNFGWYFFAGVDGQVVGHDITINGGDDDRSRTRAGLVPGVGEFEAGLALMVYGFRVSYTQVVQTEEVYGQHGGPHQFGSLTISTHF